MHRFWLGLALAPAMLLCPLFPVSGIAASKPVDRHGSMLSRYNFPPASRGDRFAHRLNLREGIKGWRHYGPLIKRVAKENRIDPYVLGAYVWVESSFNARQNYDNNDKTALGLGSVQATDHRKYTSKQLQEPYLNLTLTAREFKSKWHPHDMFATVMDVWYPAWRKRVARGMHIPVVRTPDSYVQAVANRYYALREIDERLHPGPQLAAR